MAVKRFDYARCLYEYRESSSLLDILYSDLVAANLVVNGIEGEDYQIVDVQNGVINYPAGINPENTSYSRNNWAWPNPQIAYL